MSSYNEKCLILRKLNLNSVSEVLYFFPKKVSFDNLQTYKPGIRGGIFSAIIVSKLITTYTKKLSYTKFKVSINSYILDITFFNQEYLKKIIKKGDKIILKLKKKNNSWIAYKIYYNNYSDFTKKIVYDFPNNISLIGFQNVLKKIFKEKKIENFMPEYLHKKYGLLSRREAFFKMHFPKNDSEYLQGKKYFLHEESFVFYIKMFSNRLNNKSIIFESTNRNISLHLNGVKNLIRKLPFKLTESQVKALKEIFILIENKYGNEILLQGDVGCGKTIVSLILMYCYILSGYQCTILVPTTILAHQHYKYITEILSCFNIKIALITSKTKRKSRIEIINSLSSKQVDILVGTHSLLNEEIIFCKLGLAVIDEQQRFGVEQRSVLKLRNDKTDVLYMTATPIPRTLAISVFSNLTIINIQQQPNNRKKVETILIDPKNWNDIIQHITTVLNNKEQIYFICPLITKGKKDLSNLEEMYEKLTRSLDDKVKIAILHGKQHEDIKAKLISDFAKKKINIILSTTVIEVGIHVDNATLIIIYDAHNFGLSQLHQLRGRVGRSSKKSKCLLVSSYNSKILKILEESNDGFYLSQKDLELRGPGDFLGNKQSGLPTFKFLNIIKDYKILNSVKYDVIELLNSKDELDKNKKLIYFLKKRTTKIIN